MFENKIFTVLSTDNTMPGEITGRIKLNKDHDIFKGHFPDNPVLPGVVSIQIVMDFFSHVMKKNFLMLEAQNIKFLKIIQPQENEELNINIKFTYLENNLFKISASILNENEIFFKFSGKYEQK